MFGGNQTQHMSTMLLRTVADMTAKYLATGPGVDHELLCKPYDSSAKYEATCLTAKAWLILDHASEQ